MEEKTQFSALGAGIFFGREVSARGPRAATLQAIERLEGVALRDTAREVDPSLIDEEGFLKDVEGAHRSGRYLH